MLTRLRQIVLHPKLIPSNYIKELENAVQEDKQNKPGQLIRVSPELKVKLQLKLAQLTEDCQVCTQNTWIRAFEILRQKKRNAQYASWNLQNLESRVVRTYSAGLGM